MVYLMRHGAIESQREKSFIGQIDIPLNKKGVRQALGWQKRLSDIHFDQIYCSDLTRSRAFAEIITEIGRTSIQPVPQFKEIHLGRWEGLSMAEVHDRFPEEWRKRGENMVSYRPPGGESFADLRDRVIPVFERIITEAEKNILIAAHAGVNRVILCHVLGMPLANLFRLGQDYAALNMIDCARTPWRLTAMNLR